MSLCVFNSIQYNGYIFDGFVNSNINSEMIKDEGGNVVKYIRNTLEVEFIICNATTKILDEKAFKGIDIDLDYIRNALSCPNKSFSMSYRGAGSGSTRRTSDFDSTLTTAEVTASVYNVEGLSGMGMGPYPEVLTWEPLANNSAAKCRWRCVFYTLKNAFYPTINYKDQVDNELSPYRVKPAHTVVGSSDWDWTLLILSVTEEQEVNINEEGHMEVSTKGVIEFSNERTVTTEIDFEETATTNKIEAYLNEPRNRRSIVQDLQQYFEPYQPLGFTRKQRYVYHKSQRQLEYVIVDTEIVNSRAQFPRLVKWEATHRVASSLAPSGNWTQPQGFYTWENAFDGSFVVAPGYWKGWAWVAMLVLVKQRINRSTALLGDPEIKVKDDIDALQGNAAQNANAKARKKVEPKHILTDISIVDYLHNNQVDVTMRYILLCSLSQLFAKSGLFVRLHTMWTNLNEATALSYPEDFGKTPQGHPSTWTPVDKTTHNGWLRHYLKLHSQNAVGYTGLGLSNYNLIFDPENLNLSEITFDKNEFNLEEISDMETLPWEGPTDVDNVQLPNNYAAYRRHQHFREHPNYTTNEFIEAIPTNPQDVKEAPGDAKLKPSVAEPYPGKDANQTSWMKTLDPAHSWVEYKPKFSLVEVSNSSYLPTIQPSSISNIQGSYSEGNVSSNASRDVTGITINNKTTPAGGASGLPNATSHSDHVIAAHGKPTYYVRFTGSATRIGYPIPMPVVSGLQNQLDPSIILPVYRIGKQEWEHEQVGVSADMPVFEASWDITYAIKGDPNCANISFNHPRPSEFA